MTKTPINDFSRKDLLRVLDSVRGRKGLVIDPAVSGPLSLVAEFTVLKEHGVDKIFHLSDKPFESEGNLIYFTRPNLLLTKWIAGKCF